MELLRHFGHSKLVILRYLDRFHDSGILHLSDQGSFAAPVQTAVNYDRPSSSKASGTRFDTAQHSYRAAAGMPLQRHIGAPHSQIIHSAAQGVVLDSSELPCCGGDGAWASTMTKQASLAEVLYMYTNSIPQSIMKTSNWYCGAEVFQVAKETFGASLRPGFARCALRQVDKSLLLLHQNCQQPQCTWSSPKDMIGRTELPRSGAGLHAVWLVASVLLQFRADPPNPSAESLAASADSLQGP